MVHVGECCAYVCPLDCTVPCTLSQVKLVFERAALDTIAELAMEQKTGARGLRSIMVSTERTQKSSSVLCVC